MSLPITFWGLLVVSYLMNFPLVPLVQKVAQGHSDFIAGVYLWFACMIAYEVFFVVSVWRCTAKYERSKVWIFSARFWVIMWGLGKMNIIKEVLLSGAGA